MNVLFWPLICGVLALVVESALVGQRPVATRDAGPLAASGVGVIAIYLFAFAILHGMTPLSKKPLLSFTYGLSGMELVKEETPAIATLQRYAATLYMRCVWRTCCIIIVLVLSAAALPALRWRWIRSDERLHLSNANEITIMLSNCDLSFHAAPADDALVPYLRVRMGSAYDDSRFAVPVIALCRAARTGSVVPCRSSSTMRATAPPRIRSQESSATSARVATRPTPHARLPLTA